MDSLTKFKEQKPVNYSASNKRALKKLRHDIKRSKRLKKKVAGWGKNKLNRRDHAFRAGDILVCLKRDSAKWLYKNTPTRTYTWPEIGDVVVVSAAYHYVEGKHKHKKGVRLLAFENFDVAQCVCSYKYRKATIAEIEAFIAKAPVEHFVHRHAKQYLLTHKIAA